MQIANSQIFLILQTYIKPVVGCSEELIVCADGYETAEAVVVSIQLTASGVRVKHYRTIHCIQDTAEQQQRHDAKMRHSTQCVFVSRLKISNEYEMMAFQNWDLLA